MSFWRSHGASIADSVHKALIVALGAASSLSRISMTLQSRVDPPARRLPSLENNARSKATVTSSFGPSERDSHCQSKSCAESSSARSASSSARLMTLPSGLSMSGTQRQLKESQLNACASGVPAWKSLPEFEIERFVGDATS
ncbi:MAG: hypothetical protein AB7V13_18350 [Pseudorhodoplanes sp.]|uniref:hypothetical protein n=1 Tax=Pseudorhodoplanes sp. TaxID=1934341 RepID=UPI003D13E55F